MRPILKLALATTAVVASAPSSAAIILPGTSLVAPTPGVPAGQGTLLATGVTSLTALTFATTFNQAVYLNSGGTLDFYFQVLRTGNGTGPAGNNNDEIHGFTVTDYTNFFVDGYASGPDPDGGGLFIAANNLNLANGTPSGSTTTFGRSLLGDVLRTDFGLNGLTGTENSATYIFRTNATTFDGAGTFSIFNGGSVQGIAFRPTGLGQAVPEPSTWMMMLLGFGTIGLTMRRRRTGFTQSA